MIRSMPSVLSGVTTLYRLLFRLTLFPYWYPNIPLPTGSVPFSSTVWDPVHTTRPDWGLCLPAVAPPSWAHSSVCTFHVTLPFGSRFHSVPFRVRDRYRIHGNLWTSVSPVPGHCLPRREDGETEGMCLLLDGWHEVAGVRKYKSW